ncbi:MAG: hypothetical protein J5644_04080 [Bacteroidales bacterium]|nr:hypothetical protein [Bacteroidales bacterium]
MNIFNQIKQFLYSLVDGKPCDTKNMSNTKSNQDLLEEIQVLPQKSMREEYPEQFGYIQDDDFPF